MSQSLPHKGPNGETAESRMLLNWSEHEVETRANYLDYSNLLYGLNQIPKDRLGTELPTAYSKNHRFGA